MRHNVIEISDGVNGYVDLARHVREYGTTASPRGMETREIEDAVIHIANPIDALPLGVKRGAVPGIGSVEALQLLAGVSMPDLVLRVGPQFANYTEDNGEFHGAYGLRTMGQYDTIVERLTQDPDTRQAVVTIWNPALDLQAQKRDYPCTILHQFRIRDGKLNMSVYMRSNDVWLGAAYDFFQFTRVQIALAGVLGVPVGTYVHHVGSLHLYSQHYSAVDRLEKTDTYEHVPVAQYSTWQEVVSRATRVLNLARHGSSHADGLSTEQVWHLDALTAAIKRNDAKSSGV